MSLQDELLAIEEELWTGGPPAYRRHLDEECALTFAEMAGVWSREEIAGMLEGGRRWRDVELEPKGLLRPTGEIAVVTYEATARRGDDERYRAYVGSGYVRREGAWKMVFHQQTPLEANEVPDAS